MPKKLNVVRLKKYTKNGEEKTAWFPVGTITEFENGGRILELNHINETYQIFERDQQNQNNQNNQTT